ncbi:ATP-binding protein [Corynebacterium sp.]|uniref:AAA family ATPase n=1 Tax=Corynebacterium sp. TaxID=1720 RepID=UPI0026DB5D23|nr:ATP-binding protein [Corynebacterium sp.]MDO5031975.1 ATP-binding protein [Corynebacterium sp.]
MMRIHSVALGHVRGVEHLLLEEIPETGVMVVHGENEAGKSTIVEAIDVVLNEKHGANNKRTKPLRPVGRDEAPEVTLEATVGPYRFRIHKRWFKKKASELHIFEPRPAQFTGSEADDELERILSEHLDRDLLRALFLRQEDQGEGIAAVGIPSLTTALEDSTGSAAVAEDSELQDKIDKEYKEYFTPSAGNPTGRYKEAIAQLEEAEARHNQAVVQLRELEGIVERYEAAEQAKAEAEDALPGAREELAELEEAAAQARAAQEKVTQQEAAVARALEAQHRAEEELSRRRGLIAELEALAAEMQRAEKDTEGARERAETEAARRSELEEQLEAARTDYAAAREELQRSRRAEQRAEWVALGARLDTLSALEEALGQRRRALAEAVQVPNLKEIEKAATEVEIQQRLHAAATAKLLISAPEGTQQEITADGEELHWESPAAGSRTATVELAEGTTLHFGEVSARYSAGAADPSGEELARAEAALQRALEEASCQSLEEARAAHEHYLEVRAEVTNAEREFAAALGGDDLGTLRARYAAAGFAEEETTPHAAAQEAQEGKQDKETEEAEEEALPLAQAEAREEELRQRVEEAERALVPYRENKAAAALEVATVKAEQARRQHESAAAALSRARAERDDAQLEKDIATRAQQHRAESEALEQMAAVDVETALNLVAGAQSHVKSLEHAANSAAGDMREYTGRIALHTGAAEAAERAKADLEVARERHAGIERRALAARYLREVMLRHRDAARQRYAAPFVSALNGLARTVFGSDVDFQLTEELKVEARTRHGQTVAFEELSGGAKEQLAILTRFAIAMLVAGGGVPVVIDDALGSTDSTRLQLMSTLFSQVGKHSQVLVFTCMPQRYSRVPGRTEVSMDELKAAGTRE